MAAMITKAAFLDSEVNYCTDYNTINASEINVAESLQYRTPMVIYTAIVLPIILVTGFLDNALFLIVIQRIENMKNVTNAYLASLAVSDIAFLIFVVVHKLWKIIGSPEVVIDDSCLGSVGCVIMFVGSSTSYFASLCFITLVAWERRQAVRCPHLVGKNRFHNLTKSLKMILFSWVVSFLLATSFIPSFIVFKKVCIIWPDEDTFQLFPSDVYLCSSINKAFEDYTHIAQALPFFFAMAVNIFLYFDIMRGLRESADRVQSFDSLANASSRKRDESRVLNQTIKMLIINGLTFFALLGPFEILSVCLLFDGWTEGALISTSSVEYRTIAWVVRTLSYLNAVINPIIYTVFSSRYRNAFNETIREIYYGIIPSRYRGTAGRRGRPISTTFVNNSAGTNDWNDNTRSMDVLETQDTKL
ncbi:Neuromedin-U receptor 2 [Holothuria leucospilota]|uniref:Neuromedin-U receptor 2 n=1 Tax=Holothuria leucospilota TaxID=206669 RepID=A0A9Q1GY98_HOLLE|nr:Neuromedin-U receptor 2 [Holothuria leucospilota]